MHATGSQMKSTCSCSRRTCKHLYMLQTFMQGFDGIGEILASEVAHRTACRAIGNVLLGRCSSLRCRVGKPPTSASPTKMKAVHLQHVVQTILLHWRAQLEAISVDPIPHATRGTRTTRTQHCCSLLCSSQIPRFVTLQSTTSSLLDT